jgi:hypothetical protein
MLDTVDADTVDAEFVGVAAADELRLGLEMALAEHNSKCQRGTDPRFSAGNSSIW